MREAESQGMLWEALLGARRRRCGGADVLLLAKMSVQPLRLGRTPRSAPQRVHVKYFVSKLSHREVNELNRWNLA